MATEYQWKDLSINILGRTIEGVVDYKKKLSVKKERIYGRGSRPLGITSGNEEVSGSITLHQSELQAMVAAVKAGAPGRELTDVSFDIVHTYENAQLGITTDIIVGAQITEFEEGMAQGDPFMKVTLPYIALRLKKGV